MAHESAQLNEIDRIEEELQREYEAHRKYTEERNTRLTKMYARLSELEQDRQENLQEGAELNAALDAEAGV
jgi:hypothetical protein